MFGNGNHGQLGQGNNLLRYKSFLYASAIMGGGGGRGGL